ncbi:ELM1/GtrOC1 family putative glycosyltransferase [Rickettsiales bacterium LUAb2]
MQTKIWAISDNRAGHLSQIEGVLQKLNSSHKLFVLNNSIWGKLNFAFYPFGVKKNILKKFTDLIKQNDTPDLILVIGRRNLSVSLYLKKILIKNNKKIKLVFLMPPGVKEYQSVDFIFKHRYKMQNKNFNNPKIIPIDFSPSKLQYNTVDNSNKITNLIDLKPPYIGVIIGGNAKGAKLSKENIDLFIEALTNLLIINGGSLLITTSRRTGKEAISFIKQKLANIPHFLWNYNHNNSNNPYTQILNIADILVVTGESTSMIADCIFLNKSTPVLIFDHKNFVGTRFSKFNQFLYQNNYAIPLETGKIDISNIVKPQKVENSSIKIAKFIESIL